MKIDLSKLPEGTKWIAIDSDGDVNAFGQEPKCTYMVGDNSFEYDAVGFVRLGNVHD